MSASLIASLSRLFGKQERSDCTLVFYCNVLTKSDSQQTSGPVPQQEPAGQKTQNDSEPPAGRTDGEPAADQQVPSCDDGTLEEAGATAAPSAELGAPAKRRKTVETQTDTQPDPLLPDDSTPIGDPLPAHTFVLCGGSERFRAQLDRWTQQQGYGAKPVLRVPLDDPQQLPHALSAVRFMYTGKLDVGGAPSLLRVRRQAAYLQVEGCGEACDAALLASVTAPQPGQQQQAGALAGVAQLYGSRELLLGTDLKPAVVHKLLNACRQQLVKHSAAVVGGAGAGGPGLGELVAWAFGDAPSLMSDPETRKQMEALPAAAMEALLGCDSLATDNEATVLLMLLTWLEANPSTSTDTRQRLFKLIRLSQLNDTYLLRLLPLLTCFNLSPQELRFLQEYAAASDSKRARMKQAVEARYDFSSAWYRTVPRLAREWKDGVGRSYEWCVDASDLKVALNSQQQTVSVNGKFANGGSRVVANGLEWYPGVQHIKGEDVEGVYLFCALPPSLGLNLSPEAGVLANPGGSCRLVVFKGGSDGGGQRNEAWSLKYGPDYVEIGRGWGSSKALPLEALPSAPSAHQQSPAVAGATTAPPDDPQLARWAPYLKDGKLWGCLSWEE